MDLQKNLSINMRTAMELWRAHRGNKGSVEEYAAELGISKNTLRGILNCDRNITLTTLEQIAEMIDISADSLLRDDMDLGDKDDDSIYIFLKLLEDIEGFASLDADKQQEVAEAYLEAAKAKYRLLSAVRK